MKVDFENFCKKLILSFVEGRVIERVTLNSMEATEICQKLFQTDEAFKKIFEGLDNSLLNFHKHQKAVGEFVVKATKYCSKCSKLKNQKPYYGSPIGGVSANRPEGVLKNEMNLLRNFFQFYFYFFLKSLEKKQTRRHFSYIGRDKKSVYVKMNQL